MKRQKIKIKNNKNETPMGYFEIATFFRFLGDGLAISSRAVLARKIYNTKSLSGISLKTQILYFLVYFLRYLDLLRIEPSFTKLRIYNRIMKIVYILFQVYIIKQFYGDLKFSYSKRYDTFNIPIFVLVSGIVSFFIKNETFKPLEYVEEFAYTASLVLESLAVLPQLVLLQDSGEVEPLVASYVTLQGLYRINYFVHFTFRWLAGASLDWLMIITSLIQTVLYFDFFRLYFYKGNKQFSK